MQLWFISDTHFGHEAIIQYCNRPFQNAREMDYALTENWNTLVKPEDHVHHLGDVTMDRTGSQREHFIKLIRSLNGHKRLYMGNHDHFGVRTYLDAGFENIYATSRHMGNFVISHIPIHPSSMGTARANVHGHIHNNQAKDFKPVLQVTGKGKVIVKPYVNISVEVTDYKPITMDEVERRINAAVEAGNEAGT